MMFRMKTLALAAILLTGCSLGEILEEKVRVNLPSNKGNSMSGLGAMLSGETAWIPLGLSRESYLNAERRLSKRVRIGMTRKEFLDAMKLNPVLGPEWAHRMTAGDGWFSELSRKNKFGALEVEEFVFGYYSKHWLNERFVVVFENGKIARISHSPQSGGNGALSPPSKIFSRSINLEEETRLIESFYRKKLQSRATFEKMIPQLKRIRAGWTSAELRIALGGGLYRLANGLVFFQKGLLWNDGFFKNGEGSNSIVIMPFGYRDKKGKVHKKVIIRAEGGLVTAVFWKSDALQGAMMKGK